MVQRERLYALLVAVGALLVVWYLLSRIQIFIVTFLPWWVLLLLILVPIAVLFLVVDYLFD